MWIYTVGDKTDNNYFMIADCLNVFVDPIRLSTFPLDLAIAPALENTLLWYV